MSELKPILCVGCTVIDFVTISSSFPVEDTDRRCNDGFWRRGGNASNVSTVLKVLGLNVEFLGMLSKSDGFRVLLDDLDRRQIDIRHCPMTEQDPPFSSVILVQDTGTRTIVHCNKNFPQITYEDFQKIDLNQYGWIHFEARNPKETSRMMQAILEHNKIHTERVLISLDFEARYEENLLLCQYCDYVTFSKELASQQDWRTPRKACDELNRALAILTGKTIPNLIIPWGSAGAVCQDAEDNYHEMQPYKQTKAVDTLGAGDSFMAGFIYATYVNRLSLPEAVDFANRVASYKISKFGYDHVSALLTST